MQVPLEVTFRDMEPSEAVENHVRDYVHKLEKFCNHIDSCRVALERPHRHQNKGSDYRVRIDLTIPPGHELVVTRDAGEGDVHDDLYKVVHDAFKTAERRVKKLAERQKEHVKSHPEQQPSGVVSKLFEDYGFIDSVEGREVYFHRNSVLPPGFDMIKVGAAVAHTEEDGDEGPQASSVRIVDRRGH